MLQNLTAQSMSNKALWKCEKYLNYYTNSYYGFKKKTKIRILIYHVEGNENVVFSFKQV